MLRTTRKEKDKEKEKEKEKDKDRDKDSREKDREKDRENHDKPTSSLLSLDAFRLNWTGSNEDSITINATGTIVCVCTSTCAACCVP